MIEKYIIDYLSGVLTVPVYPELPTSPPVSYVVIQKTGSSYSNGLETATVAIQSCGQSLFSAAELNDLVKAKMEVMPDSVENVFSSDLNSDYNYTNTSTKVNRYQAVFNITFTIGD